MGKAASSTGASASTRQRCGRRSGNWASNEGKWKNWGNEDMDRRATERAERSEITQMNARRWALCACAGVLLLLVAAASADEKADAVLRAALVKMHAAKTLTADMTVDVNPPGQAEIHLKGTLAAMKPNFMRVELNGGPMSILFAADGKNYYTLQGTSYD